MDAAFKLLKTIKESRLIEKGDTIVIGVSGGVDSAVLLDALARLQPEYRLKLHVAHVNYGLRGRESERDERFVKRLVKKYGIKCFTEDVAERFSVPKNLWRAKALRYVTGCPNIQNTARNIRYDFFLKVAKKSKANKVAIAHHANDQAETVFLHLTRGAGLAGLAGMSAIRDLAGGIKLIRPLLSLTREDILAYAKERRLKYVQDRTNKTKKYHRNVIRHDLLPLLQKYNPNIVQHLCKTAAILRDEDEALNEMATKAFLRFHEITFKRPFFIKYSVAIQRRILRLAYAKLTGSTADLLTDHTDKMMWIISSGKKEGRYTLPRGVKFIRKGDRLFFSKMKR